ncbi:hypothetical protein C8Q72DRAFT_416164 [Fomitopsis betulina]|nr:hypothetical protein C8Q72DRAFT_416164 [Fomitopsis betulina]
MSLTQSSPHSSSMMDYFDFNMQMPDQWSDTDSEKTLVVHTPVGPPEKPGSGESDMAVPVSYTFHPCSCFDDISPDLVLVSADRVLFYIHYHRILTASDNGFGLLLSSALTLFLDVSPTVMVSETSEVLNIILHTVYNISALPYCPSFETISAALDALPRYGISPKRYAAVGEPLYDLVVACAPHQPIDTYALAGAHDLSDVAVAASEHLLSFLLSTLSNELAERMGAIYLKKLFFLHLGRMDALKRVLIRPPVAHPETAECSLAQQKCVMRAWALAAAHVMWDARPNLSTHMLQSILLPLSRDTKCPDCQLALTERVACAVIEWASVRRTI